MSRRDHKRLMEGILARTNGDLRWAIPIVDGQVFATRHGVARHTERDDLGGAGAERGAAGTRARRAGALALTAQQADYPALHDQLGFLELRIVKVDFQILSQLESHR